MNKKTALIKGVSLGIIILGFLIHANFVLAQPCPPGGGTICNPLNSSNLSDFVRGIANTVLGVGGVVAVVFLIYAGFLFVTARGNPEQIKMARSTFTWTVIGTAVLLGAYAIATAIQSLVRSFGT